MKDSFLVENEPCTYTLSALALYGGLYDFESRSKGTLITPVSDMFGGMFVRLNRSSK